MERPELVEHTLSFLIRRLHDAGIEATATVDPTTDQSALVLEDGGLLSVENLVNELAVSAPATHTDRTLGCLRHRVWPRHQDADH